MSCPDVEFKNDSLLLLSDLLSEENNSQLTNKYSNKEPRLLIHIKSSARSINCSAQKPLRPQFSVSALPVVHGDKENDLSLSEVFSIIGPKRLSSKHKVTPSFYHMNESTIADTKNINDTSSRLPADESLTTIVHECGSEQHSLKTPVFKSMQSENHERPQHFGEVSRSRPRSILRTSSSRLSEEDNCYNSKCTKKVHFDRKIGVRVFRIR